MPNHLFTSHFAVIYPMYFKHFLYSFVLFFHFSHQYTRIIPHNVVISNAINLIQILNDYRGRDELMWNYVLSTTPRVHSSLCDINVTSPATAKDPEVACSICHTEGRVINSHQRALRFLKAAVKCGGRDVRRMAKERRVVLIKHLIEKQLRVNCLC